MEEETSLNFKALRAKFQEEALMAESRTSRPAVAGKPKHLPPPGGHCSSVLSSIHMAVEHKAVVPRVFFRDALRTSGGKRPISFPPHPQTHSSCLSSDGDASSRHSFKERHMPLVLPVLPKEPKADHKLETEDLLQTKNKKKTLLLPFKSSRSAKAFPDQGEEPTYADLTCRPASAPGELPSVERHHTDDRASLQDSENMNECTLSSLDITISPPPAESHADCESRVFSTLEKAKKKFSCRHGMSIKPKCSSPEQATKTKTEASPTSSSCSSEFLAPPPPPPALNLPNIIYISARPFSKGTNTFKSPLEKHFNKDKTNRPFVRVGEPHPPSPPKKPLPELWALGSEPKKPSRPPVVDLSSYMPRINHAVQQTQDGDHKALVPVLDAPEFPDFETSGIEKTEGEAVDLHALDVEALDAAALGNARPDWSVHTVNSEQKEVNLDNPNAISRNPPSFEEPINFSEFPESFEHCSQSEEAAVDPSSRTEEPDDHANNFEIGVYQQEMYPPQCENVYEDVENISKFTFTQSSRKWKGLKNPYADNSQMKEECGVNMWPRSSSIGDSGYLSHSQINSKECQSPNTADIKEQKKREKQRLEREKKELKEREKKENEMKKKFKVSGEEEPLYHAKVTVASKVRKNDLPVKSGDTVSIIRTTNCPKGKWLARDASHKYGYISVMNVELNIKEMLELGKKAQAAGKGGNVEVDTLSIGSSSHPVLTSSCEFTDDSEEWACEDETLSPSSESLSLPQQSCRLPETSGGHVGAQHTVSDASVEELLHTQTSHEALQKLAVFFQHNKVDPIDDDVDLVASSEAPNLCDVDEPPLPEEELDFSEMEPLPPPPLYADVF